MRNRTKRHESGRAAAIAGAIVRNPRETFAALAGTAAAMTIFINALYLQNGPHPAPIFAPKMTAAAQPVRAIEPAPMRQLSAVPIRPATLEPARPQPQPQPAATTTRNDPIAELIAPPKRLASIQRALSEFGYGQIKANGQMGPETELAIIKFEREHKMQVTGQVSDRLVKALATMTGRAID